MKESVRKSQNQSHVLDSNSKASRQAPISQILQNYRNRTFGKPVQRQSVEDEELLQGKFEAASDTQQKPVQREEKPNNTGLPDNLKAGIENLSGYSMDDVRVRYNSDKPAQLSALAYAQGTDIHVAPGQEKHLPHEAWHVVQQKQGRVQPTTQMQGVNVNDNKGLEKEADVMGNRAMMNSKNTMPPTLNNNLNGDSTLIQLHSFFVDGERYIIDKVEIEDMIKYINKLKEQNDQTGLELMKTSLLKEIKDPKAKHKERIPDYEKLIQMIDAPVAVATEKIETAEEIQEMIRSNPYIRQVGEMRFMDNDKIAHWLQGDKKLPEANTLAEIAEILTDFRLRSEPVLEGKDILTGVEIGIYNEEADYPFKSVAEIDHMVLVRTEEGWVPEILVETKAGNEGRKKGNLTSQLSRKIKVLQEVKEKGYKIFHNGKNITDKFDLDTLSTRKPIPWSSGITTGNDIQLDRDEIKGIYGCLELIRKHRRALDRERGASGASSALSPEGVEPTEDPDVDSSSFSEVVEEDPGVGSSTD